MSEQIRLRVRWAVAPPSSPGGGATEFGLQRGRADVLPGTTQADGTVWFETVVEPYIDKAGRQRFRGESVQGPPVEPFLYLSLRSAGEQAWTMRAKVGLGSLTPEFLAGLAKGAVIETSIASLGHRPNHHVQEWNVAG
jgi:hypothetical protein